MAFPEQRAYIPPDAELYFRGAAGAEMIAPWRARFDRMNLLRNFGVSKQTKDAMHALKVILDS